MTPEDKIDVRIIASAIVENRLSNVYELITRIKQQNNQLNQRIDDVRDEYNRQLKELETEFREQLEQLKLRDRKFDSAEDAEAWRKQYMAKPWTFQPFPTLEISDICGLRSEAETINEFAKCFCSGIPERPGITAVAMNMAMQQVSFMPFCKLIVLEGLPDGKIFVIDETFIRRGW
jgi:hypothetical protein